MVMMPMDDIAKMISTNSPGARRPAPGGDDVSTTYLSTYDYDVDDTNRAPMTLPDMTILDICDHFFDHIL
jgi:hypothetical protein